ncbi:MAG: hypothetical protein ACRELY_00165 [Polyangiaceae bacterium]
MNLNSPTEEDDKVDDVVEVLWKKALASWDDDKVHGALIEYAVRTENLPNVAGKYRALKDDPEKSARARKQLDAIVVAATQMMLSQKSVRLERSKPPPWLTVVTAAVCLSLLVWLAMVMLHRR